MREMLIDYQEDEMSTLLLTPEQAAAELQIARRRIFEMIGNGTLPSVKIGKSRRITRAALEDYVKSLETQPAGATAS
jgi:excisionase family DNA binding protein